MMDDAIFLITDQYPPQMQYDSNVRYVNVQYHMSDFLEIVSIDILGHGGAMNIILENHLSGIGHSRIVRWN